MNVIADIVNYVVGSLLSVFSLLVLVRFALQWARADFYNPISQGLVAITAPLLNPLRKIIPGFLGIDLAALFLAFVSYSLALMLQVLLSGNLHMGILPIMLIISALKVLACLLNIASFVVLVSIVLSFVAPMSNHPAAVLVNQVADPLMAPFRKILPDMGGLDFSPILLFLLLGVLIKIFAVIAAGFGIPVQQMWMFIFV